MGELGFEPVSTWEVIEPAVRSSATFLKLIKFGPRALNTPTEESWPGCHKLPEYKSAFPNWQGKDPYKVSFQN